MNKLSLSSLLCVLLLAGCGGAQSPGPSGPGPEAYAPANLYPLGEGYVWSHEHDDGIPDTPHATAVSRVIRHDGERYEVSNGSSSDSFEVRPGGIYQLGRSAWVLKAPIEVGATWPASGGRTARVTSLDERVEVPAGRFEACARIEESGGDAGLSVVTIFCPGVGPVWTQVTQHSDLGGAPVEVVARLLGCNLRDRNEGTPCFDIDAD